ncbi:MAG TPA: dihydroneopterin aldolase [Trebonia sp.]|jgi:dihydroneopterin aldolase|nr:dihydroneopterin aldolase [Trebonia sp.]
MTGYGQGDAWARATGEDATSQAAQDPEAVEGPQAAARPPAGPQSGPGEQAVQPARRASDVVSVRDLRVPAIIGVYDWERAAEQVLAFHVDLAADVARAAATGDVADAVDYSAVAATITRVVRDGQFRLIETAAERVAEAVRRDFPVGWIRVEVAKPIASADGTGSYTAVIAIERGSR